MREAPPPSVLDLAGARKRRVGRDRVFELRIEQFRLSAGEAVACLGPSGSGKSTLIDILALALRPDAAERFLLHGETAQVDVGALWAAGDRDALARLRARRFGYVLQTGGLIPFLGVRGNIRLSQRLAGRPDEARIDRLARELGIADLLDEAPQSLSVGQRQRVAIARALSHAPPIVFADEPTAALDPLNARVVMDLLYGLAAEQRCTLVLATHDEDLASRFGFTAVHVVYDEDDGALVSRVSHAAGTAVRREAAR